MWIFDVIVPEVSSEVRYDILSKAYREFYSDHGQNIKFVIVNKVLAKKDINYGYNSMTDKYGDLVEMGVIDSARNTKISLKNAVSVASILITTDCVVIDEF